MPLTGDKAEATIAVDAGVTPGAYSVSVRATAEGIERTAPLTVNVIGDPLQLLVGGDVTSPQLSTVSQQLIVNRATFAGVVTLSAEGLPVGVTAAISTARRRKSDDVGHVHDCRDDTSRHIPSDGARLRKWSVRRDRDVHGNRFTGVDRARDVALHRRSLRLAARARASFH